MAIDTKEIKPPKFPLTLAINGAIVDFYFDYFVKKHVPPGYSWIKTSEYRDPIKNKDVGGASNSAHMHNLAKDFVILNNGVKLNAQQLKDFYEHYVKDNWKGYSYVSDKHIHVNMNRSINTASNVLTISVIGIVGVTLFSKFKQALNGK